MLPLTERALDDTHTHTAKRKHQQVRLVWGRKHVVQSAAALIQDKETNKLILIILDAVMQSLPEIKAADFYQIWYYQRPPLRN